MSRNLDASSISALQWFIDALPFYVLIVDSEHNIVAANEAVRQNLGKTPGELIGNYCPRVVHGAESPYPGCPLEESLQTGQPVEVELFDQRSQCWVSSAIYPSGRHGPEGRPLFLHAIRDITDKKRAQEERSALQAQLIQSQKMEALARLAGGVAHDFNNLLTLILNYAAFVGMKVPTDDPVQEDLRCILRAGKRAAGLTRQLLAFGRKEAGQPRVVELVKLVGETEKLLRRTLGEDVQLSTGLATDLWRVKIDPGHVEQILLNLVINARDAMPAGGRIDIEAFNTDIGESSTRPPDLSPGRYVVLSVTDTGIGMSPDVLQRIFEPFFTTKARGKGSGLGLSTVHGIVKQAAGNIAVSSAPGRGTCVEVYLPATDEPTHDERERLASGSRDGTPDETILVVDDDAGVRLVAAEILRQSGFDVLAAEDCGSALDAARKHGRPIRLLLTDVVLEGLSGCELAQLLQNAQPDARVLYMSGYPEDSRATLGPAEPLLEKPFTAQTLLEKVFEVIDRRRRELAWDI